MSTRTTSATDETVINYRAPRLKSITCLFMIKAGTRLDELTLYGFFLSSLHAPFSIVSICVRTEFNLFPLASRLKPITCLPTLTTRYTLKGSSCFVCTLYFVIYVCVV